ncbi:signal peptidase II [Clostridiisalibacter paucivorans]|uniref:signal peptidase II n=1 Tax=Clostridiisalibacter paucivorans TaxID=408753 RepID=UPI000479B770|nr:signal peptidase II [Clostridiisalibacter paucivorans]
MGIIISIVIILFDQMTKLMIVNVLQERLPIIIIENYFQVSYVKNYGAAFGIMQNKQWFFIIITFIILVAAIFLITKRNFTTTMRTALFMVIGGAVGNLIDRVRLGYVIDFIDIKFGNIYDYPVFNIADSFIVIGTVIIAYLILSDRYEY